MPMPFVTAAPLANNAPLMLSYRHAYHAGNFADVMKHVVLTAILGYQVRKDAPLCYIDTHAGAGGYDLQSDYARKTGESTRGIEKLWGADDAPPAVADYLNLIERYNDSSALLRYPGSPWIAASILRAQDRLALCELHSSDYPLLRAAFEHDRRVRCHAEDSYRFSASLVPPLERRGLVFMDPAFEVQGEYETAVATIGRLHRKFATGTYALWYPILDEQRAEGIRRQIESLPIRDVLNLELRVADAGTHPGMYGCAIMIINPPYTLRDDMQVSLAYLAEKLGLEGRGASRLVQWVPE